jgi:hypothetical protein
MEGSDPLARLAVALEALSAGQLKLAEAAEELAAAAEADPGDRLAGAAETSRRAARSAAAAAARVSDAAPPPPRT